MLIKYILTPVISASLLFIFSVLTPKSAEAFAVITGDNVEISKKELINENTAATGQTILIEGKIAGDLFCLGQTVEIKGDIDGDVICAAQSIVISGAVSGSIRTASQNLQIDGTVDRNVTSFGQNITIGDSSMVLGEVTFAAQKADIDGIIGGKLTGASQYIGIKGSVAGDVYLEVESLALADSANVAGNVTYISEKTLTPGNAKIGGAITKKQPEKRQERPEIKKNPVQDFAGTVIWQSILVFALIFFFKDALDYANGRIRGSLVKSAGWGFVTLIIPPIAILLLIFTILGIPIAFIVACLYVLSFFGAGAIASILVGSYLIGRFAKAYAGNHYLEGLVGISSMWLIGKLPIIGGLLGFIFLLIGFGGVYYLFASLRSPVQTKTASPSPGPLIA